MNASVDAAPLIVLATDSATPSGVGEHMLALANAIRDSYRVVVAFAPTDEGLAFLRRAEARGMETKHLDSDPAFSRWLNDVDAVVLHVHAGIGWEGHGLANAGWSAGVTVVRTEHLPYLLTDEGQRIEHRLAVGMVDRLVFVSEAAACSYRDAGFREVLTATVQNGISTPCPERSRETTRQQLGIGAEDHMVITVARFTAQKNYGLLLVAAQTVAKALPRSRFIWVGDGHERAAMQEGAVYAGLAETILFLGERHDVPDLLVAADLFVLPSRFEGLPLVVLEAMALELAVVATRIGGTCEALGDNYPWLVEPENADSLAATIIDALLNAKRRRDVGAANRRRFEEKFSADRMGHEMAAIYRAVISEKACTA